MATNRWMQKAADKMKEKGTEGSFRRIAHAHGRSTHEEAEHDKHKSGKVGQKARMALAFAAARH
jgi:hypothetical protein